MRFSLAKLLILMAIACVAAAVLAWRLALGAVLLGIAGGFVLCGVEWRPTQALRTWLGLAVVVGLLTLLVVDVDVHVGVGHTTLTATVTVVDAVSGEPVRGANVGFGDPETRSLEGRTPSVTNGQGQAFPSVEYLVTTRSSRLEIIEPFRRFHRPSDSFTLMVESSDYEPYEQGLDEFVDNLSEGLPEITIKLQPLAKP